MHIKKLTGSNALKRGELLVVVNCLWRYDDVLADLRKNARTRIIRFYRHREEPVPGVRRRKHGGIFRVCGLLTTRSGRRAGPPIEGKPYSLGLSAARQPFWLTSGFPGEAPEKAQKHLLRKNMGSAASSVTNAVALLDQE